MFSFFRATSALCLMVLLCTALCAQPDVDQRIQEKEKAAKVLRDQLSVLESELETLKLEKVHDAIHTHGLPALLPGEVLIDHKAYSLVYSEDHEQAKWVVHVITPDVIDGKQSRTNDFRADPLVTSKTAVKADYWHSGFDRGHLAPSADFSWSHAALSESYFYSNMAPQRPDLNRKKWATLENKLRAYVGMHRRPLLVVSGGILREDLPSIGKNEVSIPEFFFKVAYDYTSDTPQGIAFVMPNDACKYPVWNYSMSIDSLEQITGFNFFANESEERQQAFEAEQSIAIWQGKKEAGDVLPLDPTKLPKGKFNTMQAEFHIGSEVTICGTVVSTKFSEKSGATFLNLDKAFPNQVFSVTIWKDARPNFSYKPEIELKDQKVCFTGKLSKNDGTPTMNLVNEEAVEIMEEPAP